MRFRIKRALNNKSQSALEYIMTYGWMLLVVLVAIGALSYFGILDIKDYFVPQKCTFQPGIACLDFKVGEEAVQIVLRNSLGEDITITDIDIKDCEGNPPITRLSNGQQATFTVGLCSITETRYLSEVNITYTGESGIEHTDIGEMVGKNEREYIGYDYLGSGSGATGLVAAYDFNEGSGFTLNDVSGSGNDGTIYGNTVLLMDFDDQTADDKSVYNNDGTINGADCSVDGISGKGCDFDGGDYVRLSSDIMLGNTDWTVSSWVKPSGVNFNILSHYSGGPVANALRVLSSNIAYSHYDGIWKVEYGTSNVADGEWHFLTWVNHQNQTIDLYVDGVLENEGAPSTVTNNGPVNQLGRDWSSTHNGFLDEVTVYSKALTEPEIQQHYNSQKAQFTDWDAGKYGTALSLDSVDDYIDGAGPSSIGGDKLTISAWIKTNTLSGSQHIAVKNGPYMFALSSDKLSGAIYTGTWKTATGNIPLAIGQWHHVAVVYDGAQIRLYVDGQPDSTTAQTGNLASNGCPQIGRWINGANCNGNPQQYFNGQIDSLAIYDRALTAEEIAQQANS